MNCSARSRTKSACLSFIRSLDVTGADSSRALESPWIFRGVMDTSSPEVPTVVSLDLFWRLSMYTTNPCSNPIIEASHQTQLAAKICWVLLAYEITLSRAYTITSLPFSKVMVIRIVIFSKVWGCHYTTLIDSRYRYNRYRYHKNAIINKDISPLVGIVLSLAIRACLPHCRNNVISL